MKEIRFAHLSDTHVRVDHLQSDLKDVFGNLQNPNDNLRDVLCKLKESELDFIVISGDLVHEGGKADYECFKGILEESGLKIPVFLALGNHDSKDKFREAFFHEKSCGQFYYSCNVRGLRVIVLDSAVPGHIGGYVNREQLDWLESLLSSQSEKGSIMIMHHPLYWDQSFLTVENAERLSTIIHASDIRGIFCGHTHLNRTIVLKNHVQSTAESLAFGFDYDDETAFISDRCSYQLCSIDDEKIVVHHENFRPKTKIIKDMPIDVLKAILQK
jgi:3',5'-cyclic AMP phosphodiesterase CpdA